MEDKDFTELLRGLQDNINNRLNGLIKCKFGECQIKIDDIDERISDCVNAMDNLERSINKVLARKA